MPLRSFEISAKGISTHAPSIHSLAFYRAVIIMQCLFGETHRTMFLCYRSRRKDRRGRNPTRRRHRSKHCTPHYRTSRSQRSLSMAPTAQWWRHGSCGRRLYKYRTSTQEGWARSRTRIRETRPARTTKVCLPVNLLILLIVVVSHVQYYSTKV